jgi:hypothetical protein
MQGCMQRCREVWRERTEDTGRVSGNQSMFGNPEGRELKIPQGQDTSLEAPSNLQVPHLEEKKRGTWVCLA